MAARGKLYDYDSKNEQTDVMSSTRWEDVPEVKTFQEYLRIPSVHPNVDYDGCVDFLKAQAASMDLRMKVVELVKGKPVVIITWPGTEPETPSILLNSHMDVVPVYEEHWTHPPFEAHIDDKGDIYARGTQDMKSVGIQQLEAVRRLKNAGVKLKRTVHLCFVPDEEIGGKDGMCKFAESAEFKELNVGLALDESMPSATDHIILFYAERVTWQIRITCKGEPGHGAALTAGTAGEKLHYMITKFMEFRKSERTKLKSSPGLFLGDVTTVNLNQIYGGVQANVLPDSLTAIFDIRIAPEVDLQKFESNIKDWCSEAGKGVSYEFVQWNSPVASTRLNAANPFWDALKLATDTMGIELDCRVCAGATDARYVRAQNIAAFGFSPITETPLLVHAHDERINAEVFLRGIGIFENVIRAVANVKHNVISDGGKQGIRCSI